MADLPTKKISELPLASKFEDTDVTLAVVDGVTAQLPGSLLRSAIQGSTPASVASLMATHERLIFKKKKILSLPLRNPEWEYLVSVGIRFYPQTFCIDEYSNKLLIIDGTAGAKAVLVYNWPSGTFDRVFRCSGGLVSESAVVRVESGSKFLYLRTTGDKLAKYDITSYPLARSTIAETLITDVPCGLNFMERNGTWTISDIASSELGNVRSRGKYVRTDSLFNTVGYVDCGDYLMGIYAGRPGETDVTKIQGVCDTGYGLIGQMGGQWVYPNPVTNYSQNGLRVFTYDGTMIAEGVLQADKFRTMISQKWGFTPDLIEAEGITTTANGDVFSLTVTSNNGLTNASSVHGMLIMQEFCDDGDDFSAAAAPRVGIMNERGSLTSSKTGAFLVDPTTGTAITTIAQLLTAIQKSGISQWAMYTTGLPITDMAGQPYKTGCLMTVTMFRQDIYYIEITGFNYSTRRRIYYDTGTLTWIEQQSSDVISTQTYSVSGSAPGDLVFRMPSDGALSMLMINAAGTGVIPQIGNSTFQIPGYFGVNGTFSGPLRPGQYTLTTLPSAAAFNGYEIDVTNATGGSKRCRSNGTVWQILNTTTTVS